MIYRCCEDRRKDEVRRHRALNGIDELEVLDLDAPAGSPRQRTLLVRCLKPLEAFTGANVRVEGGARIRPVTVLWAAPADRLPVQLNLTNDERSFLSGLLAPERVLVVRTDSAGDYSTYRLVLVDAEGAPPPERFDAVLSEVAFSFKVECPSRFDCRHTPACPPEHLDEPVVDYLARDYDSFRRLLLDRLAMLMPDWRERNPADLGVAVVELLAYLGDQLSYQQDAVATEAYLGTARVRTSARRHARLVDYAMHDGCNARAWVQVLVDHDMARVDPSDPAPLPAGTVLLSLVPGLPARLAPRSEELRRALAAGAVVFETLHEVNGLYTAHETLHFHTWGGAECCLPKGATRATLRGRVANLERRQVLLFEEVVGPTTGQPEDADPTHRHAVRLTQVRYATDPVGGRFATPATNEALDVTEIEWAPEDALPFPLCVSARTDGAHGRRLVEVSVARGNVVLADHGRTVPAPGEDEEQLPPVPDPILEWAPESSSDHCRDRQPRRRPGRYAPRLRHGPLSQVGHVNVAAASGGPPELRPFDPTAPAAAAFGWDMAHVLPAVALDEGDWQPRRDLLASHRFEKVFVAEVDDEGRAALRFGDGEHGTRPLAGSRPTARYRVGNGPSGNVGAEALGHVVATDPAILGVRNPMAARGGIDPETIEDVRQRAPFAFRRQERAVTPGDYADAAERRADVQRAAASFRWTGSWHTVFVTVDRAGGLPVDGTYRRQTRRHLERYRMAGYDLEVDGPRPVSLEIEMVVCVEPDYFRPDVERALLQRLGRGVLPDGRLGLFHPDNLTFGQDVYLSRLTAAVQSVAGVASVEVTSFGRQGRPDRRALSEGKLTLGRLEIARLENNPNFPEHGVLRLFMRGGK